jgi:hypothetical protein
MAPKTYRELALEVAPPFLLGTDGEAFLRALGDQRDALVERIKAGVKARFPKEAAPDSLNAIGAERGLPRGPVETDSTYADRLQNAWDVWSWAGTPTGVLRALYTAGYTNVRLVTQRRMHELDSNQDVVTTVLDEPRGFPPGPSFWNTFLVWFPQPWISAWSGGAPANNSAEADAVRRLVNQWKPGIAHVAGYIATVVGGHFWGEPGLEWGDVGLDWGGANVHWDP